MTINTLKAYNIVSKLPFGNRIFSRYVTLMTPYFTSIKPYMTDLRPGYCKMVIKDRRAVRNHLGTIHAIAMCNMAEFVMGMVAEASIKPDQRWIPKTMKVNYLKKAKGDLTAVCEIDPELFQLGDLDLPIKVTDPNGQVVFTAVITLYISKRK